MDDEGGSCPPQVGAAGNVKTEDTMVLEMPAGVFFSVNFAILWSK